jgi:transcriptional regulator with XRE-family HTH domain
MSEAVDAQNQRREEAERTAARINAHVARRLREARAGANLNQTALADHLGLTQAAVSLWESGQRKVGIAELVALAAALDRPLTYFLDFGEVA